MRDPEIMAKVKEILAQISAIAPGHSVELRVPPYSAIQCGEGPKHTRGTPPNVVEMSAETLIALATGNISWSDATHNGSVIASGERSDISALFTELRAAK